ncbi:type IV secretion-system coupling DNA-binding domain protein [Orientia tsutsugamushi str. UT76]|uniref:Conjugative transfer protein n=1 Tax=Orientia tsutsugamushi TaxID=784 RepID=A0A2U3R109_ORITS|nr:type IV secretion-system coupling DNA-binding domain protein [Orientia tsutsugamushi str. UT76]SPR06862.1 conjugative transfer protein [Orientia tsutsugamushi]
MKHFQQFCVVSYFSSFTKFHFRNNTAMNPLAIMLIITLFNHLSIELVTANPSQRATLHLLISVWISIAIKALICRNTNSKNKTMWFILDELPPLQKV